jgi:hypothetical protein
MREGDAFIPRPSSSDYVLLAPTHSVKSGSVYTCTSVEEASSDGHHPKKGNEI